jgi:hypothetical protein
VTAQPVSSIVVSGTAVTFQITFKPLSDGTFTDTVIIESNDSSESVYNYVIMGVGEEAYPVYLPFLVR